MNNQEDTIIEPKIKSNEETFNKIFGWIMNDIIEIEDSNDTQYLKLIIEFMHYIHNEMKIRQDIDKSTLYCGYLVI